MAITRASGARPSHLGTSRHVITTTRLAAMRDQRAEVSLNIAPHEASEPLPVEPREFRILVVGDFGGRGSSASPSNEPPRRVDRDDLDSHLARIAPRLRIEIGNDELNLAFTSLDDFHPDQLAARVATLAASPATNRESRPSLASPDTSAERQRPDIARAVSGGSLLDDMLEDVGSATTSEERRPSNELSAFIDRAVEPHLVRADPDAEARAETARRDVSAMLRRVLHHPDVQAVEASWRSLDFLVRRLDTDGDLSLFLFDRPRDHVAKAIEKLARERSVADDERWALVVVLHAFDEGDAGAESLAHIAMAAKALDAPCVASAPASFTGADSLAELGDDELTPRGSPDVFGLIRQSQDGRFLGLTYPRVLMRAPYGHENPCDTIEFEEIEDAERHGDYLWGSGAALVALLVGEAFAHAGWAMGGRIPLDVSGLPYFTYRRGPETVAKSCAEGVMSERVARHLLGRGLMPVAWIRDTDRVRIVDLRSVSDPPAALAASWAGTASRSAP
jgi:type VI secretion system protein ImpC